GAAGCATRRSRYSGARSHPHETHAMSAPHLLPGFASHWIDTQAGKIFARSAGSGEPVLLLHGFGETHLAWRKIAPRLAKRFRVVLMDLRGYGWSAAPESENGAGYTKRAMAGDVVKVMEELGAIEFALVGHDRGARVGLRLALDHPGRVKKLALLDIAPLEEALGDGNLARVGRARFMSFEALLADRAAGKKLIMPTLVLWSAIHFPENPSLLDVWREWADDVSGEPVDCGHYLAEEAPEAVLTALEAFLS